MKRQADKHRSEHQFAIGDQVYLKLQPYVQSSLAPRANQKLAFKFFGPYTVINKIGKVAYKLKLPAHSTVHPVFHVSQLKQAIGKGFSASATLPDAAAAFRVPERLLQKRFVAHGLKPVQQVLVKWSGMDSSLATWEDLDALRQQFPRALAWGQAGFLRRGDVSSPGTEYPAAEKEAVDGSRTRVSSRLRKANTRVIGPDWK